MIKYENECCDCAVPGYPCLGSECPNYHVAHFYCDVCKEEAEQKDLYDYGGKEICSDCLLKIVPKVY